MVGLGICIVVRRRLLSGFGYLWVCGGFLGCCAGVFGFLGLCLVGFFFVVGFSALLGGVWVVDCLFVCLCVCLGCCLGFFCCWLFLCCFWFFVGCFSG